MRLLLMFDLPVETVAERRAYRKFRKFLIDEGFIMHQYSIYSKILLNASAKEAILERIKPFIPNNGLITVLSITEKQFSRMIYLVGEMSISASNTDQRIVVLGEIDD